MSARAAVAAVLPVCVVGSSAIAEPRASHLVLHRDAAPSRSSPSQSGMAMGMMRTELLRNVMRSGLNSALPLVRASRVRAAGRLVHRRRALLAGAGMVPAARRALAARGGPRVARRGDGAGVAARLRAARAFRRDASLLPGRGAPGWAVGAPASAGPAAAADPHPQPSLPVPWADAMAARWAATLGGVEEPVANIHGFANIHGRGGTCRACVDAVR